MRHKTQDSRLKTQDSRHRMEDERRIVIFSVCNIRFLSFASETQGCSIIRVTIAHVIPAKAGIQRLKNICYIYIEGLCNELIR
jgi:hypothetical protein